MTTVASRLASIAARAAACTALVAAPAATASAQPVVAPPPPPAAPRAPVVAWLISDASAPLGRRTTLVADVQRRFALSGEHPEVLLARAGLLRALGRGLTVGGGYAYMHTGAIGPDGAFPEHRLWEDVRLAHRVGTFGVSHRVRLEQRWISVAPPPRPDGAAPPGGDPLAAGDAPSWLRFGRVRYQLRATHPVPFLPRLYVAGSEEILAAIDQRGGTTLGQNRALAALGTRLTDVLRAEVGYMNQAANEPGEPIRTRAHVLTATVGFTAPQR